MKHVSLEKYNAILKIPYNKSHRHPWMKSEMRAAQFAPFAALTGHEEAVNKICQYLEAQKHPAEYELEMLKRQLDKLQQLMPTKPLVTIYFLQDSNHATVQYTAHVKRLDAYTKVLILEDGLRIDFKNILSIEFSEHKPSRQ